MLVDTETRVTVILILAHVHLWENDMGKIEAVKKVLLTTISLSEL